MRDDTPKDLLGYVVVSLPDAGHWQGFFVVPQFAVAGDRMLARVQDGMREAPPPGMGSPETLQELPGVAATDQPAVGALSAVLCELMARGTVKPEPPAATSLAMMETTGAAAHALHRVTGERWLLVTGTRDPRGGHRTRVRRFDALDVDEAREAIVREITRERQVRGVGEEFMREIRRAQDGKPQDG